MIFFKKSYMFSTLLILILLAHSSYQEGEETEPTTETPDDLTTTETTGDDLTTTETTGDDLTTTEEPSSADEPTTIEPFDDELTTTEEPGSPGDSGGDGPTTDPPPTEDDPTEEPGPPPPEPDDPSTDPTEEPDPSDPSNPKPTEGPMGESQESKEWDMSELKIEPDTTQRPLTFEELLAFRKLNVRSAYGEVLSSDAAESLCATLRSDPDYDHSKIISTNIPVIPSDSLPQPIFDRKCIKWVFRRCNGIVSGPFDPTCSYWMPMRTNGCSNISPRGSGNSIEDRKRRRKRQVQSISLFAVEAITLCATLDNFSRGTSSRLRFVALKTDEPSIHRCQIYSYRAPAFWTKREISPYGCYNENLYRYMEQGEHISDSGIKEKVNCFSSGELLTCGFR